MSLVDTDSSVTSVTITDLDLDANEAAGCNEVTHCITGEARNLIFVDELTD